MSKSAIVPVRPDDWAMIQQIAPVAATARMFGVTKEQAAIIMLKGHELRLGLAASFEFIHVIDGKPSISPKGCLALIHSSGELKMLEIHDIADDKGNPAACNVHMERVNGFKYTVTYTMDDAKRANLVKPGSAWEKYPANMLRWRAVGYCADVVFPDVIGGMLRPEELGADVDEGGEPVAWSEVTTSIPDASVGLLSKKQLEGDNTTRATRFPDSAALSSEVVEPPPLPAEPTGTSPDVTTPDEFVIHTVGIPESPMKIVRYPLTIDALIAAGYSAEAIVVANEGRVPSTAADCIRVAKILEGQTS